MKKTKKWLSLGMGTVMMMSVVGQSVMAEEVTCQTKDYSQEETVEISLAVWNVEDAFASQDDVLTSIEEKFNVKFVPENITWDDYTEKIQLWAASGSLPDIFVGNFRTTSNFRKWAQEGLLKEIPEDLSFYPTLDAYMNSEEKNTCQVDGKTYCIFRQTFAEQSANARQTAIAYRWDLAQEAGITEEPQTWEEFDAMIQAIIAADLEGTNIQGATLTGYDKLTAAFLPYSNAAGCVSGTSFYWIENEDGTYVPAYLAGENLGDDTLAALNLLRGMYENGTIEADVALSSKENAQQKFLNGQSAALIGTGAGDAWENVGEYWSEIHGSDYWEDVKFLDLMPDQNGEYAYAMADYAWSESFINYNVDDVKLERILAVYDYLLTDEGAFKGTYGMEGITFDFNEAGAVELKDGITVSDSYPSTDVFSILVRWNPNTYDDRFPATTIAPDACTEADDRVQEHAKTFVTPEYNYQCTSIFQSLDSGISLNVSDDVLNITTGDRPVEEMWQEIISNYQNQGLDSVIEQVNAAIAES